MAIVQGLFYTASGAWPLVHMPSFEAVTGPKPEGWLVKTVGSLILVAGGALTRAGLRRSVAPELKLVAAGAAGALGLIDLWYAGLRRRISPVYLIDAGVQAGIVLAWALEAVAAARVGPPEPRPA